jgi:hypothetical protein
VVKLTVKQTVKPGQPNPQMRDKAFGAYMRWLARNGPFQARARRRVSNV